MSRDIQNTQRRSRSSSPIIDTIPRNTPADAANYQDDAILAQLAAMTGLLQLPVGESLFQDLGQLRESYMQQYLSNSSVPLAEQPIPSTSSQPFVASFPPSQYWSHQGLFGNMPTASGSGMSPSLQMPDHDTPSYANSVLSSPPSPDTSGATEDAVGDERSAAEEKRRRNTAASARFRIKKKQRTINLERSVSDLTGRAEELEREAADLRRENGWLKEIVMLKGTRLAALNLTQQLHALNQTLVSEMHVPQSSSIVQSSNLGVENDDGEEDEVIRNMRPS